MAAIPSGQRGDVILNVDGRTGTYVKLHFVRTGWVFLDEVSFDAGCRWTSATWGPRAIRRRARAGQRRSPTVAACVGGVCTILEWAYDGSTRYTIIGSGTTPVSHGVLGELDPTLIDNGLIHLRLRVVDVDGFSGMDERAVVIEGDNKIGDVALSSVRVDVGGLPIEIVRNYDSKHRAEPGTFGFGGDQRDRPAGPRGDLRL